MRWLDVRRNFTASDIQHGVPETTTLCIREDDASDSIIDHCNGVMVFVTMTVMSPVVPAFVFYSAFINNK